MSLGTNQIIINIDETPKTLVKINQDNYGSQYYLRESTQEFTVNVRHTREKVLADGTQYDRHNVELVHTVFPTDTSIGFTRVQYIVTRNLRNDDYDSVEEGILALTGFIDSATVGNLLSWVS